MLYGSLVTMIVLMQKCKKKKKKKKKKRGGERGIVPLLPDQPFECVISDLFYFFVCQNVPFSQRDSAFTPWFNHRRLAWLAEPRNAASHENVNGKYSNSSRGFRSLLVNAAVKLSRRRMDRPSPSWPSDQDLSWRNPAAEAMISVWRNDLNFGSDSVTDTQGSVAGGVGFFIFLFIYYYFFEGGGDQSGLSERNSF